MNLCPWFRVFGKRGVVGLSRGQTGDGVSEAAESSAPGRDLYKLADLAVKLQIPRFPQSVSRYSVACVSQWMNPQFFEPKT